MKISGIYTITNLKNNKIYVGYSNNIKLRLTTHKSLLNRRVHSNKILQNSYNKYGKNNFKFEVLEECTENLLASQEN